MDEWRSRAAPGPGGGRGTVWSVHHAAIAAALDERRDGPRYPLREDCVVLAGQHALQASLRDVSTGGAMIHGIRGVLTGDLIRLRLSRLPERPILARVRGVSLLGLHVSIEGLVERALWREALRDVFGGP